MCVWSIQGQGFLTGGGVLNAGDPYPERRWGRMSAEPLRLSQPKCVCSFMGGMDLTFVLTAEVMWLSAVCAPSIPPQRPGGLSSTLLVWFIFSWRTLGKPVVPLKKNASLWYDAFFFTLKTYSNENHVFEHVLVAFFWWKLSLKLSFWVFLYPHHCK